MMAKFYFQNHQGTDVELAIEPWAMSKVVPAGAIVEFEVNDSPPPELEFCITEEGQPYVYVISERVRICTEGEVQEFTSPFRPPMAAFRVLRKLLWS
jgi:hypothetical protein